MIFHMRRLIGFTISILLHLLIFVPMFTTSHQPKHNPTEQSVQVTLLSQTPNSSTLNHTDDTGNQQNGKSDKICSNKDKNYTGIGILVTESTDSGLIIEAPPQYPAYKAGMRVGDRIYDPYKESDSHGVYHYTIQRSDFSRTIIDVKKENICFRK